MVGLFLPAGRVTPPIPLAAAMASEESSKVRGPPPGVPLLEEEEVEPAMDVSPDPPRAARSSAASGQPSGSSPVGSAALSAVGPGHGQGPAASGLLLPARPGEGARAARAALVAAQVEAASARTTPPAPQGWWTPPPHPTGMKVGHLRDVYLAIPDARRLDAWKRWCAQFPTQVEFPLGFKACLPALLEVGDEKGVMTAHRLLAAAPEDKEIDGQSAAVSWAWATLSPPYMAEADPHVNHAAARQEWLARDEHAYLLSAVQVEFTQVHRDMRPRYYATLPPWWSEVEVPVGFPACMPRYVAYFATALQPGDHIHRAFAILATNWVIGVASTWYAVVRNRGRLWHLSASLVAAIRYLGPEELAAGRDGDAATLLASMLALHDQVDWWAAVIHLRRKRMAPGKEPDTRGFVHCTKGLEEGEVHLCEGLGRGDYPYADGCGPTTSPPPSGWDAVDKTTPALDGGRGTKGARTSGARRGGRGAPGRTRGGYHDLDAPSPGVAGPSGGGSSRAYSARESPWFGAAQSRRRDPPLFVMVEPFPLRHLRGGLSREPLPQSVARGLQEMLPAVAPVIWDAAGEVTLIALADTVGWLRRRLASFAAQVGSADESSAALRLLEETALPAVGAHLVTRLEEH